MKAIQITQKWDLIYIDGSHDYEVVKSDVDISIMSLNDGGLLVLDDSSLYQDYYPEKIKTKTFAGHPGPSKVLNELIKNKEMNFLIGVGHLNLLIK